MPPAIFHEPLTDAQRALLEEYERQWNVVAVLRSVWPSIWRKALARGMDMDEVAGAAWQGVVRAAQKYDPAFGTSFATYAARWIGQYVARAADKFWDPRLGPKVSGDSPRNHGERKTVTLWDYVAGPHDPARDAAEADRRAELRRRVAQVLRRVPERHRRVLELRWGLDGRGKRILEEVGHELGITRERVRQLEAAAMRVVRVPLALACGPLVNGIVKPDVEGGG